MHALLLANHQLSSAIPDGQKPLIALVLDDHLYLGDQLSGCHLTWGVPAGVVLEHVGHHKQSTASSP